MWLYEQRKLLYLELVFVFESQWEIEVGFHLANAF